MPGPAASTDPLPVASLLTPLGRGAVSVIGLYGHGSLAAIKKHFLPATPCRATPAGEQPLIAVQRLRFGYWQRDGGECEEVVVVRLADEHIEVHCHGGRLITLSLLDDLARAGCRIVDWHDYLSACGQTAWELTIRHLLSLVRTEQAAAVVVDQAHGALHDELLEIAGLLRSGDQATALSRLEELLRLGRLARQLVEPWQITLVGLPNTGKSSLCNALLGYQRAIVWQEPGTTRDIVTGELVIDGWVFQLHDTAGLRETEDALEAEGTQRARCQVLNSDLLLAVGAVDVGPWPDAHLPDSIPIIHVLNKVDLLPADDKDAARLLAAWGIRQPVKPEQVIRTSAATGVGIEQLRAAIHDALVNPPPTAGAGVPLTDEHLSIIEQSRRAVSTNQLEMAVATVERLANQVAPVWPTRGVSGSPKNSTGNSVLPQ